MKTERINMIIRPNNPFLVSEYISPEYFCDRVQETHELLEDLHNGWNITLIAPRRIGKTGLIRNAFYQLKETNPEIKTYYIDIMGTQNLRDFIGLLASEILGSLDSDVQKAIKHVNEIVKSCHPVLTFDDLTGVPKFTVDVDPARQETSLKEIFQYLGESKQICYIAIDEFQKVADYPEGGTEAILRSYIQFLPNVRVIFAGSKRHMLTQMFMDASRPFYRSTRIKSLEVIPEDAYFSFASYFFNLQNRKLTEEVFNQIYALTKGHTWYVQALLKELYSYWQSEINLPLLDQAFRTLVKENGVFYETLFDLYSPSVMRLLKAIAREGTVKEINASAFISKYNLKAASSVSSALKVLTETDQVCKTENGYRLYDPFLAAWLRMLY